MPCAWIVQRNCSAMPRLGGVLQPVPAAYGARPGRTAAFHRAPNVGIHRAGYTGLFAPLILDTISADLLLSCDPRDGNDLLAHYRQKLITRVGPAL